LIRIYSKRTDEDSVATAFAVFQAVCRQYGLLPSKVCFWSFFNCFYQLPNAIVYRSQFKFFPHCPLLFEEMLLCQDSWSVTIGRPLFIPRCRRDYEACHFP
jgi:hypothetical protein